MKHTAYYIHPSIRTWVQHYLILSRPCQCHSCRHTGALRGLQAFGYLQGDLAVDAKRKAERWTS